MSRGISKMLLVEWLQRTITTYRNAANSPHLLVDVTCRGLLDRAMVLETLLGCVQRGDFDATYMTTDKG